MVELQQIEMIGGVERLQDKRLADALQVQSIVLRETTRFFHGQGFTQLLPVMISPITDPLCHSVVDASIRYGETTFTLTKSMILHKQLALMAAEKIFIISPNVRLEHEEKASTGRHLLEFTQVDFEWKGAKAPDIMRLFENLYQEVILAVQKETNKPITALPVPFKTYTTEELMKHYGVDWEPAFSRSISEPAWVLDHEREFYDKEGEPGHYLNYDLIYPGGFGEGLSGGEREHEHTRILMRMERNKMDLRAYASYIDAARKGFLYPSAGAGFGVERMVRYLCGRARIEDVSLFPKVPGQSAYHF
jgi:asparaginyl-tRNA synthetase